MSALTGCNQSYSQIQQPSLAPKLRVVTTFLPMYWFTKAVVGEEVEILIPPGTEHDYQVTPANVSAIATANVLVKNGIDFEQFLDGIIKSAQKFHQLYAAKLYFCSQFSYLRPGIGKNGLGKK